MTAPVVDASDWFAVSWEERLERSLVHFLCNMEALVFTTSPFIVDIAPVLGEFPLHWSRDGSSLQFSEEVVDKHAETNWSFQLVLVDGRSLRSLTPEFFYRDHGFWFTLTLDCAFVGGNTSFHIPTDGTRPFVSNLLKYFCRDRKSVPMDSTGMTLDHLESKIALCFQKKLQVRFQDYWVAWHLVRGAYRLGAAVSNLIRLRDDLQDHQATIKGLHALLLEVGKELKDTKDFVKSKRLKAIRLRLENEAEKVVPHIYS